MAMACSPSQLLVLNVSIMKTSWPFFHNLYMKRDRSLRRRAKVSRLNCWPRIFHLILPCGALGPSYSREVPREQVV